MQNQMSKQFDKFDAVLRNVLSVSSGELREKEKEWKKNQKRKKQAKTSPASRVSDDKA
jgi:hypothetical protein